MPDQGYRALLNHLRELRAIYARFEPDHAGPGRERVELKITEAKAALRAHVRAQVARSSPRR